MKMRLCSCMCIYYEGQNKCFTGKLSVPPPCPFDTEENLCWLFSSFFHGNTYSQLDFLHLWQNGSIRQVSVAELPCMEYQSLNPAFPMENGNLIPDSLHRVTRLHTWRASLESLKFPSKHASLQLWDFKSCHDFVFQLYCHTKSCSTVTSFWTPQDQTNFSENAFENVTKGFIL